VVGGDNVAGGDNGDGRAIRVSAKHQRRYNGNPVDKAQAVARKLVHSGHPVIRHPVIRSSGYPGGPRRRSHINMPGQNGHADRKAPRPGWGVNRDAAGRGADGPKMSARMPARMPTARGCRPGCRPPGDAGGPGCRRPGKPGCWRVRSPDGWRTGTTGLELAGSGLAG